MEIRRPLSHNGIARPVHQLSRWACLTWRRTRSSASFFTRRKRGRSPLDFVEPCFPRGGFPFFGLKIDERRIFEGSVGRLRVWPDGVLWGPGGREFGANRGSGPGQGEHCRKNEGEGGWIGQNTPTSQRYPPPLSLARLLHVRAAALRGVLFLLLNTNMYWPLWNGGELTSRHGSRSLSLP
jgi:hypothetical protein